mgnify:CR=1 FL=1
MTLLKLKPQIELNWIITSSSVLQNTIKNWSQRWLHLIDPDYSLLLQRTIAFSSQLKQQFMWLAQSGGRRCPILFWFPTELCFCRLLKKKLQLVMDLDLACVYLDCSGWTNCSFMHVTQSAWTPLACYYALVVLFNKFHELPLPHFSSCIDGV